MAFYTVAHILQHGDMYGDQRDGPVQPEHLTSEVGVLGLVGQHSQLCSYQLRASHSQCAALPFSIVWPEAQPAHTERLSMPQWNATILDLHPCRPR